jgi:hydrogenase nickel incorporation protein HypA/HybF
VIDVHELSICQALIDQVANIAADNQATRVTVVHLQMGPLAGVEQELLQQAYPIASAGTIAQDSELRIQMIPVRVHCSVCGQESEARINRLICGACGAWRTRLLSGDELLLASIELDRTPSGHGLH